MDAADATFKVALSKLLTEVFDGPPGQECYILNPGDLGLSRQLESLDAAAASKRPMPGRTTIASHAAHLLHGLTMMNRLYDKARLATTTSIDCEATFGERCAAVAEAAGRRSFNPWRLRRRSPAGSRLADGS